MDLLEDTTTKVTGGTMVTTGRKLRVMVSALIAGVGWPRFLYEILTCGRGRLSARAVPLVIDEAHEHILRMFPGQVEQFEVLLQTIEYEAASTPTEAELVDVPALTCNREVPLVLAAVQARVDCLVTQDETLPDPCEPLHQYLRVVLPATFLRPAMGWNSEELQRIRNRRWQELEPDTGRRVSDPP